MKKKLGVGVVLGALLLGSAALAGMHLVTTPAGCTSAFKHDKGSYNACMACVRGKGKYKENIHKKYWACER